MSTGLYLGDAETDRELINRVIPLSDAVLFDSAEYEDSSALLAHIAALPLHVIDLQWVALSPWREQLRAALDRHEALAALTHLSSIEIEAEAPRSSHINAPTMLFAAWVLNRLQLEPIRYDGEKFSARHRVSAQPASLTFRARDTNGASPSRLSKVVLSLGKDSVTLQRGAALTSTISVGEHQVTSSRPFDDESLTARIERYFVIGESTVHYPSALRTAIRLLELLDVGTLAASAG